MTKKITITLEENLIEEPKLAIKQPLSLITPIKHYNNTLPKAGDLF